VYHSRFKGTHYEAGLRYGDILYKHGADLSHAFSKDSKKIEFVKESIKIYEREYPEVLDEIRGVAEGMRIPFEDLSTFLLGMYCFIFNNRCTNTAVFDGDNIIFGRNSDFLVSLEKQYESTYYKLDNSNSFIGNTTTMIQMEDGVNEHGLAVGLTFIYPLKIKPGLNAGMMVRYILEKCKNVAEALEKLQNFTIGSAQTITMIDRAGDMAVVECNCETLYVIRPEPEQIFVHATNNLKSPEMLQYQYDGVDDIHSGERYETVYNALKDRKNCSVEYMKEILTGKQGFMCQYDRAQVFDAVWSSIYDLKNMKIYRAEGNPSRVKYKEDTRLKFIKSGD